MSGSRVNVSSSNCRRTFGMKTIVGVFQTFTVSREYTLDFDVCKLLPSARDS